MDRRVPISVVVPARNEARRIEACLSAIKANHPAEVILVDGSSSDRTRELAAALVDRVIIDAGRGPGAARQLGAEAASMTWLAYVDADVDLPPGSLQALVDEATDRHLAGMQAGLRSVGSGDYWSEELAWHHNQGRSRNWFGFSSSVILREAVVNQPFDHRLRSGEDMDLRLRLEQAGLPLGVSERTVVTHHFSPGFPFARDQWLADGAGLGRLVRKHGRMAMPYAFVPFGAAVVGWLRGLWHPLRRGLYFASFAGGNFIGLTLGLLDSAIPVMTNQRRLLVALTLVLVWAIALAALVVLVALLVLAGYAVVPLAGLARSSLWPPIVTVLAVGAMVALEVARSLPADSSKRQPVMRMARSILMLAVVAIVLSALRLVGILLG